MRSVLGIACLAAAWFPDRALPHCSQETAPTLELQIPREGMSIEKVCWAGFNLCAVDTFYREALLQELVENFGKFQHAVFAYPDSLVNYLQADTVRINGQVAWVDTGNAESLWVNIHSELKGALPKQGFVFKDRYPVYLPDKPYNTTYLPIIDTPFVAFFDTFASTYELGIGPLDGCFFEPSVYMIKDKRIYKKSSWETRRMPGIWVAVEDFFRAVSLPDLPVPEPRPSQVGIRRKLRPPAAFAGRKLQSVFLHDLRGKMLGRLYPRPDAALRGSLPMGWYFLAWQGERGPEARALFFPGGDGIGEAAGIPRPGHSHP